MTKIFNTPWLRLLIIPYVLFLVLVFCYSAYSKTIPVSFWDEVPWVGKSYFFQFYIHGDFNNRIWQSGESYDQPKLAEYSYGVWLYPLYLSAKQHNGKQFDYTQFLIKNGFYEIDESYMNTYADYKRYSNVIKFDDRDSGFPEDYVAKYGEESLKPIILIYQARVLNIFLLASAVIFAYFFVLQSAGVIPAVIFSFLYGFNSLIIDAGLKAHSEALFLFTFNAAFLFMSLYFAKGRKILYLLLFSLFVGLCMSTKLNGSMLLAIFFISNIILIFVLRKKRIEDILLGLLPILISLIIFVSLNPFTYSDPYKNVRYMFDWRMKVASVYQANSFKEALLPDKVSRVKKIFENFYFSEQVPYFNGIGIVEQIISLKNYGTYLFVLFFLGLFYSLKLALQKNITAIVICCSFFTSLASMSYYLILDWSRYYAHLPLFFVMFQLLGLFFVIKYTKLLVERAIKSRALRRNLSRAVRLCTL